jgi:L-asparaginase II
LRYESRRRARVGDNVSERRAIMTSPAFDNPVLLRLLRGGELETQHRGAFCVVRGSETIGQAGDVRRGYFMRSASKLFQALPSLLAGAAERFHLGDREIALMCASHGGEDVHVETAKRMLDAAGLGPADLACGAHYPLHVPSAAALRASGRKPTALHNNCSGKHAGMLLGAIALGASPRDYVDARHPVQLAIRRLIADLCQLPLDAVQVMIDGCSAPTFHTPLDAAARAFAAFAQPPARLGEAFATAVARVWAALAREPLMIGGHDRFCTAMIEATGGRVVCKVGADGYYGAMARDEGIGVALHVDDGAAFASERVLAALLDRLGLLDGAAKARLARTLDPVRQNHAGLPIGRVEVDVVL